MATNDMYRVWSVNFPISQTRVSPCDRLYRPYILTSGSVGCPDLFAAAFAQAVQTDDELLRHMGHIDDADHGNPSSTIPALDSPSIPSPTQYTLELLPRPHKRASIPTPDIWVLEDPSPIADKEGCADNGDEISMNSGESTPELSISRSLPETSEKSSIVEPIEDPVKITDSEVDTTSTTPTSLTSLSAEFPPKQRRAQLKKDPALLQAWSSDTAGFRNLDQASIPFWVPALQRVLVPKPNPDPRPKRPYRKWAPPTPGPSKSAAVVVNKLAARRPRKTKKEWISQQERVGDWLRRIIEARLAEITLLEAEVTRLKITISRCRGCAGRYWSSREAAGEVSRHPPSVDAYTHPPIVESGFKWIQIEPAGW